MKKAHGKGIGINVNAGGLNRINEFKIEMTKVSEGLPIREFKPLTGYVLPRAEEREAFRAIPSWTPPK